MTSSTAAALSHFFALKRRGLKSIFVRDHWDILDTSDNIIGAVQETSGTLALLRRWLSAFTDLFDLVFIFVSQTYDITLNVNGAPQPVAKIIHRKNPFIVKMSVDTTMAQVQADPRIVLASASMLSIIDAAKNS